MMQIKPPANQDKEEGRGRDHLLDQVRQFNPFKRGHIADATPSLSPWLTFHNIVWALGLVTFFIFVGSVVSARIAFLFAALFALAAVVILDMASRRRWEREMVLRIDRMNADYERVVREVARNRNEMTAFKKGLSEAEGIARRAGRAGDSVEQKMFRAIAAQLSQLSGVAENPDTPQRPALSIAPAALKDVSRLTDDEVMHIVDVAAREDNIDVFMQPIVNLPQRKTRFFEVFARIGIAEGVHLPAERYMAAALEQDLMPAIDNLLLLRVLQFIRDTEEGEVHRAFFCNASSLTLNDPKFMSDLVEFIAQNRVLAPRLVFELGQKDLATMGPDILPILEGLSHLGCRFSMDKVESVSFDFLHLAARHIRYVKIDAALVLKEMKAAGGLARLKRLKMEMDQGGIDLIVEKIEEEKELREILDINIDYGQGFLFGMPEQPDMVTLGG